MTSTTEALTQQVGGKLPPPFNIDMEYKVVLIGHKKRVGKDTVADFLEEIAQANGYKVIIYRFSSILKATLATTLGLGLSDIEVYKNNNTTIQISSHTLTVRQALQYLGDALKQAFGRDVIARTVEQKINIDIKNIRDLQYNGKVLFIVPDFRFPNEHRQEDWITVNVQRAKNEGDEHLSERALDNYKFDYVVDNNGSYQDLHKEVAKLFNFINDKGD